MYCAAKRIECDIQVTQQTYGSALKIKRFLTLSG